MSRESLQSKRLSGREDAAAQHVDVDAEHDPEVSRRASNAALNREAVQMRAGGGARSGDVHQAAERGKASPAQAMPHMDKIQASFGRHDVSGIQAHVGDGSAQEMGAEAYATGNHVAFAQQPDLHTAAHEAAHVVQQAQGVNLYGGVGQAGDTHEQSADAVADRVVAGESAEDLLGATKSNVSAAPEGAVQRKEAKKPADPKEEHEESDIHSAHAIGAQLKLLAKHMYLAVPQLQAAEAGPHDTAAHTGPAVQTVQSIFDRIKAEAEHCAALMRTLNIDKTIKQLAIVGDVKRVLGAWTRFQPHMFKTGEWARKQGNPRLELNDIKNVLDGFKGNLGYDETATIDSVVENDHKVTDDKASHSEAVKSHMTGALEAIESVDSGNAQDASRIKLHVDELAFLSVDHVGAFKSHKAQLTQLINAIKALAKTHPDLESSLEASVKKLKALK